MSQTKNNLMRRLAENSKSLLTAGFLLNQNRSFALTAVKNSNDKSHPEFNFDVSKFNDVHIRSNNIIKFVQQADFSPAIFESCLKSCLFFTFYV
jgi:hypothetical protein